MSLFQRSIQEENMAELAYHDFRSFVEEAKKISDYRLIEGADWDGEIGALVESTAELVPQPPMLLFDKVKGYPAGFRVCSLPYAAYKRVALALGLPIDKPKLEILLSLIHISEPTRLLSN